MARNTLDEWVYFLKNEEIKSSGGSFKARGLQLAKKRLDIMKLSETERLAYSRYADDLHYQASMVESSYGLGKIEGLEEGIEQGIVQTARNMLADGIPVETVEKCTGLHREEIKELIAEQKNTVSEPAKPYKTKKPRKEK